MSSQPPVVHVPADRKMAEEPARTIGEEYAGKDTVKLLIVGVAGLLVALGVNVTPDVPQYVEMIANAVIPIGLAGYAKWQLARNAKQQAEATRDVVYSPTFVAAAATDPRPARIVTGSPADATPPLKAVA